MKRFQFRLQVALDVRRRREEQLRGELAQLNARRNRELQELKRLLGERDGQMHRAAAERTGPIEPEASCRSERRLAYLGDAIDAQRTVIDVVQGEIDRKVAEVVAATQETHALDNLRDRHLEAHRQGELHEEQVFLDELATIRSARDRAER